MVNYHDPVTIEREFGAYAFLWGISGPQPDLPVCHFNRGARKALARCGWYIYVSLPALPRWPLLEWYSTADL
jgi:hypothetical protein